jgi:hypothetical protein
MTMTIYIAPLALLLGVLIMLFGNPKAQPFAPALYWLGLAFTLYQFSSKFVSIH